jgi:hypothetical protein
MNSQVLIDREFLERVLNAGWGSETDNALDDLRGFLESAAPATTPDHLPGATKMVAPIPDAEEGVLLGADDRTATVSPEAYSIILEREKIIREGALRASAMAVPKCKCSMSISVLGDGCRYCQPQEYIDRLSEMLDDERADNLAIHAFDEAVELKECAKYLKEMALKLEKHGQTPMSGLEESAIRGAWKMCAKSRANRAGWAE